MDLMRSLLVIICFLKYTIAKDVYACSNTNTTGVFIQVWDGRLRHDRTTQTCSCTFQIQLAVANPPNTIPVILQPNNSLNVLKSCGYVLDTTGGKNQRNCSICLDEPAHIVSLDQSNSYTFTMKRGANYSTWDDQILFWLDVPLKYHRFIRTVVANCEPLPDKVGIRPCFNDTNSTTTPSPSTTWRTTASPGHDVSSTDWRLVGIIGWCAAGIFVIALIVILVCLCLRKRGIFSNQTPSNHHHYTSIPETPPLLSQTSGSGKYESLEFRSDDQSQNGREYDHLEQNQATESDEVYLTPVSGTGNQFGDVSEASCLVSGASYQHATAVKQINDDYIPSSECYTEGRVPLTS